MNFLKNESANKAGANEAESVELGEALVNADYRSHFSHGLNRLEFYYNDMKAGAISSSTNSQVSISFSLITKPLIAHGTKPQLFLPFEQLVTDRSLVLARNRSLQQ